MLSAARNPPPPRPGDRSGPSSLLSSHDYVSWWLGTTLSTLGTSVSTIAYPMLVLSITGSVAKAGLIGSGYLAGILLTSLWGGALADRVSRRAILGLGPLVQAAVLAAVAAEVRFGHPGTVLLAGAALLTGLCSGVVLGAGPPALRRIVPPPQLAAANAQARGRDMAAQLLGAPLGGLLFGFAHWLPFGFDALSYLCASAGALMIRRPLGPDRDSRAERSTVVKDIADGLRFVRGQPFLKFVLAMGSVVNMVEQAFLLLLIALVRHRGGSPAAIGVVSAMMVAGALAGTPFGPVAARRFKARRIVCVNLWVFAGALTAAALVPSIWQLAIVVCLAQVVMVPVNVVLQTYVMQLVPDGFLGRVAAVNRFGAYALEWLGPPLAGLLALLFGLPGGLLALPVVMVPLAVTAMFSRSLGVLDAPIGGRAGHGEPPEPTAGGMTANDAAKHHRWRPRRR